MSRVPDSSAAFSRPNLHKHSIQKRYKLQFGCAPREPRIAQRNGLIRAASSLYPTLPALTNIWDLGLTGWSLKLSDRERFHSDVIFSWAELQGVEGGVARVQACAASSVESTAGASGSVWPARRPTLGAIRRRIENPSDLCP